MSLEDLKMGIALQIRQHGYTEIDVAQLDELPYGWIEDQGWSLAHKAGTSTYVVYRPRTAQAAAPAWEAIERADADRIYLANIPFRHDSVVQRILDREREQYDLNAYNRPPAGRPFFTDGDTTFRLDETLDPGTVMFGYPGGPTVRVDNLASNNYHNGHCYLCNQDRICTYRYSDDEGNAARLSICLECAAGPPVLPAEPTQYTNARCFRCQQHRICTLFSPLGAEPTLYICEECRALQAAELANQPATGVQAMMAADMAEANRRFNRMVFGDGNGELAWGVADQAREYARRMTGSHRRAQPGVCVCGFTAVFTADMDAHINDEVVTMADGVPKRWRRCERCRASALCREVVVMGSVGWPSDYEPTEPMLIPTERVYRCDGCTRGL